MPYLAEHVRLARVDVRVGEDAKRGSPLSIASRVSG